MSALVPLHSRVTWIRSERTDPVVLLCVGAAHQSASSYGGLSGQVMGAMKEACILAVEKAPMRLVEPVYVCDLLCSGEQSQAPFLTIDWKSLVSIN